MNVLCVAEKPSISKSIAKILPTTANKYIKILITCVSGHLTGLDFPAQYRGWNSCNPGALFDAEPTVYIPADKKTVEQNLLNLARRVDTVMIWTDCDREGEHIGMEIVNVCRRVKPNIIVKRARFSAIIAQQIHRAAQHPVELDRRQADSVDARIILDLKVGAAFTRLQTLTLQNRVTLPEKSIVSYGPCQFPTLGFVVERYMKVKDFRPEAFWFIHLELTRGERGDRICRVQVEEGHIFNRLIAISLYTRVLENPRARVLDLTTVELQKAGSRLLRMTPKRVLELAEKLYQQGFVSYPRTETDQFDPQFDCMSLVAKQAADPTRGKGKNNDKAHPPIHPTAHTSNFGSAETKRRRYLACCSQDAKGLETTVEVNCGGEFFSTFGLVVTEKNYLEVYPYDKWTSKSLPAFQRGEEFDPTSCMLKEGETSAPKYLTEADLVTLMDKNGIGTDATIATHIDTIIHREYVIERMEGSIKYPVSKPTLRRETERRMVNVCEGGMDKAEMLRASLQQYKRLARTVSRYWRKWRRRGGGGGGGKWRRGGNGGAPGGGPPGRAPPRPPNSRNGQNNAPMVVDDFDDAPVPRPKPASTSRAAAIAAALGQSDVVCCSCGSGSPRRTTADEEPRLCKCKEPGVQRTVQKENANKGRKFWACAKRQDAPDKCDFFEWADEPPRPQGDCPSGDSGMSKRPRSFGGGGGGGGASSFTCFKCQEPGHLATDCPGGDGGGSRSYSSSSYKSSGRGGGSKRGGGKGSRGGGTSKRGRGAKKKSNFAAADDY
ncbi:prokaryotic type I DNA topoisomerase [Ephemerocybe angulata]|uniref:DNA topoisomerase n=1 Tax=Ephemerocybe angulata TaxID=980116 RepID=A0A8H6MGC3_9AGAR|nr:prokaryotic type I DNA topoisomerase [Tulosesus angulatus]